MPAVPLHRRALSVAVVAVIVAATASNAAAPPQSLSLRDAIGDANAINDQGEGLFGGVRTARQVDQADLRHVNVGPLRDSRGIVRGLRVTFSLSAPPAPLADTPLAYGLVMQTGPDCRLGVEYVTGGRPPAGDTAPAAAALVHSCDGTAVRAALPAGVQGQTIVVAVPYRVLPSQAQAGATTPGVVSYVRTAPAGAASPLRPVEIDGVQASGPYSLPR